MALMSANERIGSAAVGLGRPSDVKREVLRRVAGAGSSGRKLNSIMLSGGASRVSAAVCSVIISFFSFSLFSWFVLLRAGSVSYFLREPLLSGFLRHLGVWLVSPSIVILLYHIAKVIPYCSS